MEPWPRGVAREVLPEIDSTNAEALRRAARGKAGPRWILAHRQTAARGRRGRAWIAPPGQFAASLAMPAPGDPAQAALRSFSASLALREALQVLGGPPERLRLKWPNDVLLDGRKLAGILLEAAGSALVIGFGVNLTAVPPPADLEDGAVPPIHFAEADGRRVEPEDLLRRLAPAFARWEDRLVRDGFAPVREAWLSHSARLGETVVARLPGREIRGRFETIDPSGAIVLGTPAGRLALPAADLHFPATEDADAARH